MSTISWGFPNQQQVTDQQIGGIWQYKEVDIPSATLINPQLVPMLGITGVTLIEPAGVNMYYEWKMNLEYTAGTTPYTVNNTVAMLYSVNNLWPSVYLTNLGSVSLSNLYWQFDSRAGWQNTNDNNFIYDDPANSSYLAMTWNVGDLVGGDGSMKAKIWYKAVKFG